MKCELSEGEVSEPSLAVGKSWTLLSCEGLCWLGEELIEGKVIDLSVESACDKRMKMFRRKQGQQKTFTVRNSSGCHTPLKTQRTEC